jgi:vanillate O-demethylase ferredoxin subunit
MRDSGQWGPATVRSTELVTPTVRQFEIAPLAGVQAWSPGSHIDVSLNVDERPATRSYSLVGEPDPHVYRIAVKFSPDGRGGSRTMWSLRPGARLDISAPKNLFELAHGLPEYLLVAGGIGITPIVSMALSLARRGANVRLVYGARTDDELAYREILADALGERLVTRVNSRGERVDAPAEIARLHSHAEAYVCGPIGLLDAMRRAWSDAGRDPTRLRYETFANTGRHAPERFWVRLPGEGMTVDVASDTTLLDAMLGAGIDVLYDCRRGECGLCALDVLDVKGEIDHRDVFLSEHEKRAGKRICACVSRVVHGGVVLDSTYRREK